VREKICRATLILDRTVKIKKLQDTWYKQVMNLWSRPHLNPQIDPGYVVTY
jgi:hypothetical protein